MTPQKTTATFTFTNKEYSVNLFIDYQKQIYDIIPSIGGRKEFKFLNGNTATPTSTKWITVAELIIEATKFAEEELADNAPVPFNNLVLGNKDIVFDGKLLIDGPIIKFQQDTGAFFAVLYKDKLHADTLIKLAQIGKKVNAKLINSTTVEIIL